MSENLNMITEDAQKDKYLTFSMNDELFAIEMKFVIEIIKMQEITELPNVQPAIKGVINLRENVIPVMDLRLRFGKEEIGYHDRTCIIVVKVKELVIGIIVDKVEEVLTMLEEDVVDAPEINKDEKCIKGIGKSGEAIKIILDCEELVKIYEE